MKVARQQVTVRIGIVPGNQSIDGLLGILRFLSCGIETSQPDYGSAVLGIVRNAKLQQRPRVVPALAEYILLVKQVVGRTVVGMMSDSIFGKPLAFLGLVVAQQQPGESSLNIRLPGGGLQCAPEIIDGVAEVVVQRGDRPFQPQTIGGIGVSRE